MTKPDADKTTEALVDSAGIAESKPAESPVRPDEPPAPAKAKDHNIRVSHEVIEAARKDGEDLLRSLQTTSQGLRQTEAENRARTVGPRWRKSGGKAGPSVF